MLELQEPVYIPPQNSLFALNPSGTRERLSDGIVLAGEPSDEHIDIRDVNLSVLKLV